MPTPQTVTITDTRRVSSPDPGRLGKHDLIVMYADAQGLRGSVRIPAESASDLTIGAAIGKDLEDRGKWRNRPIKTS